MPKPTRRMSRASQVAFAKSWVDGLGIESQLVDVHSHIDGSLSYEENIKNLKKILRTTGRSQVKAVRGMSAAECDVAIGNCGAGFHDECVDACRCGDQAACDVKVPKKKQAAKPKAKAKKPKTEAVTTITNKMPSGYEIRKWRHEDSYGHKVTSHAVMHRGRPIFDQNKTFKSLTDARKALKAHADTERLRRQIKQEREHFEKHGNLGKTGYIKPKAKTVKTKKRSAQTTMSGKKKPQKKPKKPKRCVRVKVKGHTRKCPTRR